MSTRGFLAALSSCGGLFLLVAAGGTWALDGWHHDMVMGLMFLGAAVYAAAVWLVRSHTALSPSADRRALFMILAVGAVARCMLITTPPLSTDIYRYVWDGRVEAAGVNPYRYKPADPALAFLRDREVYPRINRAATAVTIYPPFAQMTFWAVTRVANSVGGMKGAMVAFEGVTVSALLALLRMRGLSSTRILLYAWNPLVLFEFAGSGHIDAAALALMVLACALAERRYPLVAGAVLAGATLIKFFPAVIAPALYRRWGWRLPAAAAATSVLLYLPFLGVGRQVLGFLPGYAREEGLASGSGFFLLNCLQTAFGAPLPAGAVALYGAACGGVLVLLAARAVLRPDPAHISLDHALALLAAFTVMVSPHLPWYFTWVVPLMCFRQSWALIYLTAAAPLLYEIVWAPPQLTLHAALYVPFVLLLMCELNGWWSYGRNSRFKRAD